MYNKHYNFGCWVIYQVVVWCRKASVNVAKSCGHHPMSLNLSRGSPVEALSLFLTLSLSNEIEQKVKVTIPKIEHLTEVHFSCN